MSKRRVVVAAILAATWGAVGLFGVHQQRQIRAEAQLGAGLDCPDGHVAANAAQILERFGTGFCTPGKLPRSQASKFAEADAASSVRGIEARAAALPLQARIANAVGNCRVLLAGTFGRGAQAYAFAKATNGGSAGDGKPRDAGRFGSGSLTVSTVLMLLALGLLRRRRQGLTT